MQIHFTLDTDYPWLMERVIYLTRWGSRAYGTETPESDVDIRGIVIPPIDYLFGFNSEFAHASQKEPDIMVWSLKRFMTLAYNSNPNILEVLFTSEEDHIAVHPIMRKLIAKRDMFVSKFTVNAFLGYATQNMQKVRASQTYASTKDFANPAYLRVGYDTKDAMHAVRLLRMAKEILTGKGVNVRRADAKELLDIREGDWDYDQFETWTTVALDEAKKLLASTKLPDQPNVKLVEALCIEMTQDSFAHHVQVPVMATGFNTQPWNFDKGLLLAKKLSETEAS